MPDHQLMRVQRNEVVEAIAASGLRVDEFDWVEVESGAPDQIVIGPGNTRLSVEALVHTPTGYAYSFDTYKGQQYAMFRPGSQGPTQHEFPGTWANQMHYVRGWLKRVKADVDAPDLWAELREAQQLEAQRGAQDEDRPFDEDERRLLESQLHELRELLVQRFDVQDQRLAELDGTISYLVDATERLSRFDWFHALRSSLVGLVLSHVIPAGAWAAAWHFLGGTIGHLFGGGTPALPGPGTPEL